MNRFFILLAFLFLSFVAAVAEIPASAITSAPPLPDGANPATFPVPKPKPEWLSRFQKNLNQTQGKSYDLLFDGDSITDFWQGKGKEVWTQHYGSLNAVDFGISGDRVENLLWRLKMGQVAGMDPKLVVLMIGTNNTSHEEASQIADGIKEAVSQYLQLCPHAHVLLLGIFPRGELPSHPLRAKIAEINSSIASLEGDRVTYMDIGSKFLQPDGSLSKEIMPDFLHPSSKGYEIWADAIQPVVDKYVK